MSREVEVRVPDIGDFDSVEVVEILVAPGDRVSVEDPLVSLESDKATMEVPSPVAGEVLAVKVSMGDAVSEGSLLVVVSAADEAAEGKPPEAPGAPPPPEPAAPERDPGPGLRTSSSGESSEPASEASPPLARFAVPSEQPAEQPAGQPTRESTDQPESTSTAQGQAEPGVPGVDRPVRAHAGPAIRRFARELGVDLAQVAGSGRAGRVLEADLKRHVRSSFESGAGRAPAATAPSRTADVTELERFRMRIPRTKSAAGEAVPSTLALALKAAIAALRAFPELGGTRAGEEADADADADAGSAPLVVAVEDATQPSASPVLIADPDRMGLRALARALSEPADAADAPSARPLFALRFEPRSGGRSPRPVRTAQMRFALGVGGIEVVPHYEGSPGDALADGAEARFEPRLELPIAIDPTPEIDAAVAERFLDHWAEIMASPARLLL